MHLYADALWRRPFCNMTFACRHDSEQPEEAVAMMNVVEPANADQRESNNQGFFLDGEEMPGDQWTSGTLRRRKNMIQTALVLFT